jgi:YVTN family beta-propeller protein
MHPTKNHLYVTSSSLNSVAIIDTTTLAMVDTVLVGSNPTGLAFSESGDKLYIATSGASFIDVLDTSSLEIVESLSIPQKPFDLEMGCNGILYATSTSQSVDIMRIDTNTGDYLGDFSNGVSIYRYGLLKVSPDKQYLYFGNRGLSPGTLARYDISGSSPILEKRNGHGDLGSNGQDIAVSNSGDWVTYAVGGGNSGYNIALIQSTNFQILGSFDLGPYPREAEFSPDDKIFYAVHSSGHIDVWDTESFLKQPSISTSGEAFELFVEPRGQYLFAAFSTELRAYDTGRLIYLPEPNSIEIFGSNEIADNSSGNYTAIASYVDGSTKDITDLAKWSVEPNEIATVVNGLLTTNKLYTPEDIIVVGVEHSEEDVTVYDEVEIVVFADCSIGELIKRNILLAAEIKNHILQDINKALSSELTAMDLLDDLLNSNNFVEMSNSNARRARQSISSAIHQQQLSKKCIEKSLVNIYETTHLLSDEKKPEKSEKAIH